MLLKWMRKKWHGDLFDLNKKNNLYGRTLMSHIQNEYMTKNDFWKGNKDYIYAKTIHELLNINCVNNHEQHLLRIGNRNDGGYIMINPLSENKIAYSFGISDDVTWDLDMADKYGYDVFMYDHTIKKLPEVNCKFHWYKQGITGENETRNLKHLETLMKKNGHANVDGMVLKMDVEGCEWDILANIDINVLEQFDQIVMEMHGLNDSSKRDVIMAAISKLVDKHFVTHIHANNYSYVEYYGKYILPNVIEVTLLKRSKYQKMQNTPSLPLEIDAPCNPQLPDIQIGRW